MFVAEIQVDTWTYIVADSGLLVDDQCGYTDVLRPCCDVKARVPSTNDDSRVIIIDFHWGSGLRPRPRAWA
jgi:hypothetical protein